MAFQREAATPCASTFRFAVVRLRTMGLITSMRDRLRRIRANIERESREWMVSCTTCGRERSVWSTGGIRWKAIGEKRTAGFCSQCGTIRVLRIYRPAKAS